MIVDIDSPGDCTPLLEEAGLPVADITQAKWLALIGWQHDNRLVAAGGLEVCGKCVLLRSLVVERQYRGRGFAVELVDELHRRASDGGFDQCFLLTLDADSWFSKRFDYHAVERSDAPDDITESAQFARLCPDKATLMRKQLTQ